jgi:indolepyruvate ferredoxin oxidoreductase
VNLFALMAYKDEYEVARLSLDPSFDELVAEQYGPDARLSYRLHPPLLRALGLRRKISLGPWFRPGFRLLVAARRLRGTAFDPFGYAQVRRVERQLVAEYMTVIDSLATRFATLDEQLAVQIAELPDVVRGYEQIKLAAVATYRERLDELTCAVNATPAQERADVHLV